MKQQPVYIKGMSVVDGDREMPELLKRNQLRRCPFYVKLSANTAAEAIQQVPVLAEIDPSRIGTILSTSCGPQESNIDFADTVVQHGPAMCSPATFTFTVPNSCAGQICIINGFKGASTMLMGNNPLTYGSLLLQLGKADYMLCGSVEEITEDLLQALQSRGICQQVSFQAASAMVVLSRECGSEPKVAIYGLASMALTASPYLEVCPDSDEDRVAEVLTRLCADTGLKPGVVYNAANGTAFDAVEAAGIAKALGENIQQVSPKLQYGDSIGAAFMAAVVHAAQALAAGEHQCPVAVTGVDLKGNYVAAMLKL